MGTLNSLTFGMISNKILGYRCIRVSQILKDLRQKIAFYQNIKNNKIERIYCLEDDALGTIL